MGRAEAPVPAGGPVIEVEVVYCPARARVDATRLRLPAGATVAQALSASGLIERHTGLVVTDVGVWGRMEPLSRELREGDRVEVYRPLQVAPMDARRTRHEAQKRGRQRRASAADNAR
jgi:uncharacterized protein